MPHIKDNETLGEDVDRLYDHARIANEEMGVIKEDVSAIKTEIVWIKESTRKIDDRTWYILVTIILGTLISIVLKFK